MISMIVTVDNKWAISNDHKPLISIPDDLKFIRDTTFDKVIIMGRHTFENMFNGKLMPNRTTIILTRDKNYMVDGAVIANSLESARKKAMGLNKDIFVLGGKTLYNEFLPDCDEIHVTAVDYTYYADSYFPNLDKMPEWVMVDESEEQTHFDVVYYFRRYQRRTDYRP